jgi:hypothetical protein
MLVVHHVVINGFIALTLARLDQSRLLHVVGSSLLNISKPCSGLVLLTYLFLLHGPRFGKLAEYSYAYTSSE